MFMVLSSPISSLLRHPFAWDPYLTLTDTLLPIIAQDLEFFMLKLDRSTVSIKVPCL